MTPTTGYWSPSTPAATPCPCSGSRRATSANPILVLQIGFTPDGHHLVITTTANSGQIDFFTVGPHGQPSATFTANPAGTPAPFGFTFDDHDHLVVTDAANSALRTYTVHPNGTVTQLASQCDGQVAMCWVAHAAGNFYVANAGSNTLTGYHIDPAGTPTVFTQIPTREGPVDLAITRDGEFLYVQAGTAGGVDGFHIKPDGTLAPIITLTGPNNAEGIAVS